ncbi:unnamed protein product [Moneuplotes crassus]|uniref:Uncharacterized protein n=1 Tax=Euplotes crassus TaxID=5936 RepID=A0AAD1XK79_EUPCR|nr:unnamed protein product [Moneuplotes crassus]
MDPSAYQGQVNSRFAMLEEIQKQVQYDLEQIPVHDYDDDEDYSDEEEESEGLPHPEEHPKRKNKQQIIHNSGKTPRPDQISSQEERKVTLEGDDDYSDDFSGNEDQEESKTSQNIDDKQKPGSKPQKKEKAKPKPKKPSKKPGKATISSKAKRKNPLALSKHQRIMADMLTEIHNSVVKLRKKEARKRKKVNNEIACENPKLLELVFGNFLEEVAVNFDTIFELLVDDLMIDEINNLNHIENMKNKDLIRNVEVESKQKEEVRSKSKQKKTFNKRPDRHAAFHEKARKASKKRVK